MWQSTTTHPASLWARTGASTTSMSVWRWPSAPASSSEAVLSLRKKDSWDWRGRARCGQVPFLNPFPLNHKLTNKEEFGSQGWKLPGLVFPHRESGKRPAIINFMVSHLLQLKVERRPLLSRWRCGWKSDFPKCANVVEVRGLHSEMFSLLSGQGGHAYLKEWLWWAGLLSSKSFCFCCKCSSVLRVRVLTGLFVSPLWLL